MKTKETIERCDNPNCNTFYIDHRGDEPSPGYHFGRGFFVGGGGGGPLRAFYACTMDCILPAAKAVKEEAFA